MGDVVDVVAFLITLASVLAAGGHAAYLGMLSSAAKKRAGGQPAVEFAKKRYPVAGVTVAVTLLSLLIAASSGVGGDIFAILLAGGGGLMSMKALQSTQSRFRSGQY